MSGKETEKLVVAQNELIVSAKVSAVMRNRAWNTDLDMTLLALDTSSARLGVTPTLRH